LVSEVASVTEVGWRKTWQQGVQLDITGYTGQYKDLVTTESGSDFNKMSGRVSGAELSSSFQIKSNWLVRFNYSHAIANMGVSQSSLAKAQAIAVQNTLPKDMSQIVSMWDVNERWQLNTFLRYVSHLRSQNIPAYLVADASVVLKQTKSLSWELVARNLGQKHFEWGGVNAPRVGPSIALYVTVKV
jgi:iron complex outermembrane receptor protein